MKTLSKEEFRALGYLAKLNFIEQLYIYLKGKSLLYTLDFNDSDNIHTYVTGFKNDHFFGPNCSEPVILIGGYFEDFRGNRYAFPARVMSYDRYLDHYMIKD